MKLDREDEPRRVSDRIILELIDDVRGLKEMVMEMRDTFEDVKTAKRALFWSIAILAGLGGIITWFLNLKDHFKGG